MYPGVQCIQVLSIWRSGEIETKLEKHDHFIAKSTMYLPYFLHIVINFTCSSLKKTVNLII